MEQNGSLDLAVTSSDFRQILKQLAAPFEAEELRAFPIAFTRDKKRALAAFYVDNRAIMDRLDEVVGPENWRNEFKPGPGGGVLCGLSIRIGCEWITKWDGADNTDVEPVKGGLSTAMRRAAVQWGIGRYLYRVKSVWVPWDEAHKSFAEDPVSYFPKELLPEPVMTVEERKKMVEWAKQQGVSSTELMAILKELGVEDTSRIPRRIKGLIVEKIKERHAAAN